MPEAETTFWVFNEVSAVLVTAALAAVIAIWGIISQRGITARQTTLEFIRNSESDEDMIAARATFWRLSRDPAGLGPWAAQPLTDEFKHVRTVLNEYEMIAIGIQRGILDDELYRRWYKSGVIRAWNHAAPFVLARRNSTGNEALWHEFEEMARWYKGSPGMPRRGRFWAKLF
ncbi:MAG: DUF4760 domain-containing protein [Phenylobacterium sp.]|uniref:DUF4760 domain-containing protein n=1 Tax=Phenylobacterium sp. TaxID=1871053 RepID=UPI001A1C9B08|nr:DUF4760 domain-containing protein [Phenylobacterium sp.]MBJ7412503.1 DUF4760 domain-containing protein [Phenylobacterium sp.]